MTVKTFGLGSDEPASYTNIESAPQIAEKVGLIIATFALIEPQLPKLYSWITNMSKEDANASLSCIRSFAARLEIVEATLTNHTDTAKAHAVATWFCKQLKAANNLRNRYAHAHYRYLSEGSVNILPYGNRDKASVITLEAIEGDISALRKLAGQFFELFRLGAVPPELHAELQKLDEQR